MKSHLRSGKDFPLFIGGAQVAQHVTSAGIYSAKHLLVQVLKKACQWNIDLKYRTHFWNFKISLQTYIQLQPNQ